ncbi:MAG: hypothetical protein PF588_00835 [Candidatus Kapabacteria bacterium]|jgi:hypothetical protein|nr:hypothetical protein [Candidatus Kapabacteria bacterium]
MHEKIKRKMHNNSFRKKTFGLLSRHPTVFIIYKAIAIVLVWSGIWGLSDELIFPDHPLLRYCLILTVGLFLLWIDDFSLDELTDITPLSHDKDSKENHDEYSSEPVEHDSH